MNTGIAKIARESSRNPITHRVRPWATQGAVEALVRELDEIDREAEAAVQLDIELPARTGGAR